MAVDFVVPAERRRVIQQQIARIQDVFDVGVRLCDPSSYGAHADGDPGGSQSDSGCVLSVSAELSNLESESGNVWVYIDGEDKEKCQRAKEYIVSLCSENSITEDWSQLSPDMLDKRLTFWEYESGAVIKRLPGEHLRLQGPDENIIRAQSLISMETASPTCLGGLGRHIPNGDVLQNGAIRNVSDSASPRNSNSSSPRPELLPHCNPSSHRTSSNDSVGVDCVDGQWDNEPSKRDLQQKAVPSIPSASRTLGRNNNYGNPVSHGTSGHNQNFPLAFPLNNGPLGVAANLNGSGIPEKRTDAGVSEKQEEIIALMQKLGYPREMVEQVLLQLGEHASSNEVLQILLNMGSPSVEQEGENRSAEQGNDRSRTSVTRKDMSDGIEEAEDKDADPYRAVIIDGSNVAMSYGNKNVFACKGIDTVVMWFLRRGHKVIYVFVPSWRKEQSKPETPIQDQEVLIELEKSRILVWTPSRRVKGRRMICYDDRYILNLAIELDGIIVSNDTFRDLCAEKPEYQKVVEERLLMYSFAGDKFMPPDDPLGRNGPSLDNFLRKTPSKPAHQMQPCPYGKKCTYGNKCKYSHPERTRNLKPTSEILLEKDRQRKEQRIKEELHARANKPDPIVSRLEKEAAEGIDPGFSVGTIPEGFRGHHLSEDFAGRIPKRFGGNVSERTPEGYPRHMPDTVVRSTSRHSLTDPLVYATPKNTDAYSVLSSSRVGNLSGSSMVYGQRLPHPEAAAGSSRSDIHRTVPLSHQQLANTRAEGNLTVPMSPQELAELRQRAESNLTFPLSSQQMATYSSVHGQEDFSEHYKGNTVPLARGSTHHPSYEVVPTQWQGPPQSPRVQAYRAPAQPVPSHTFPLMEQRQNQPNRTSLTAPLPGHTPHNQPFAEHLTAPLTSLPYDTSQRGTDHVFYRNVGHRMGESSAYQNANQGGKRYVMPVPPRDSFIGKAPVQHQQVPSLYRESSAGDLIQDFNLMALQEQSQSSLFDDERQHSYPFTNPHRSSPGLGRNPGELSSQTSVNMAADDEGYFSPRHPVDPTNPFSAPPVNQSATANQGYPVHPNSDGRILQSHGYQYMHLHNSQTNPHQTATWGQQTKQAEPGPQHVGRVEAQPAQLPSVYQRQASRGATDPSWKEVGREILDSDEHARLVELLKKHPNKP